MIGMNNRNGSCSTLWMLAIWFCIHGLCGCGRTLPPRSAEVPPAEPRPYCHSQTVGPLAFSVALVRLDERDARLYLVVRATNHSTARVVMARTPEEYGGGYIFPPTGGDTFVGGGFRRPPSWAQTSPRDEVILEPMDSFTHWIKVGETEGAVGVSQVGMRYLPPEGHAITSAFGGELVIPKLFISHTGADGRPPLPPEPGIDRLWSGVRGQ
jgi:hypothetical protein